MWDARLKMAPVVTGPVASEAIQGLSSSPGSLIGQEMSTGTGNQYRYYVVQYLLHSPVSIRVNYLIPNIFNECVNDDATDIFPFPPDHFHAIVEIDG